ncbi:XRE family transcriptional regulator [Rhodococcus rhodnii]|uniref:HTH cro/C1-type domain-containing protein n=2 Tax=Rhodococcus rhodnii TaxID=38312 RepID=R7WJS4_9NOCA|nr:helix-turn-helix transcriptional regulator [Rhodococcus rhodnii]EOM75552.1 hypothetical protein Rrhod_3121 [Rhodococcus rhodnii LMG 5362]TXG88270.1 XRE family transcriptional regulator [Rhodococcus rhodnii]TXG88924.1 XRE family transcriptional regulator [Rhodococcus rhodnii]
MTNSIRAALAAVIRTERGRHAITQTQIAYRSGFSRSTIRRIERGERAVTVDQLVAIADAIGVKPAELLEEAIRGRG